MTISHPITVLGAGIAGLAAALALRLRGAEVRVLEKSARITEVGAGLQISSNGARALRALGLGEALDEAATGADALELMDGERGSRVAYLPLNEHDYHFLHRADLIEMLYREARAQGVTVELDAEVGAVEVNEGGVRLALTDGRREEVPVLIAADGVHSVARPALGPSQPPIFTGQAAWRALVRPSEPQPPVVRVWMGSGRHLVHYPIARGGLVNIVAIEERSAWTADGWNMPDDPARLRAAFADFVLPVRDMLANVEAVHLWGLHLYPVLKHWYRGALCLLGDAAHPTLPFLAQGANMGLEDAYVLARSLDGVASLAEGFAAFEGARRDRTAKIVAAARANARNYHLRGLTKFAGHSALKLASGLAPHLVTRRFDWIYDYDPTA